MDQTKTMADEVATVEKHASRSGIAQSTTVNEGSSHGLKRRLGNRQIQLIAIGGSIGTAVFVSIAGGLAAGGPGNLLIAFIIATAMMGLVNNCMAEMAVYMPVEGAFVRMAGQWGDEALEALAGWNFFLYEAILAPFEISALVLVLSFWSDKIPAAAIVVACIVLYAAINLFAVQFYGESEFWLSTGKLILFLIVFSFTLVTMCGGNPAGDAYGFRYWDNPGSFAEYITAGSLGRFEGFLACLWNGVFTVCGPEYIAMVAAETKFPRKYLKQAFKTTFYRFVFFFIGSALCVGVVVAYNDPTLIRIYKGTGEGAGTGAASPYVIAMSNLGIGVLPHIVNALLVTSIFSAGNAYIYAGSRTLFSLVAISGKAPKFLRYTTKSGVPVYCLAACLAFSALGFLCVSSSSSKVLGWLISVLGTSQIINYMIILITYLSFHTATRAQKFDRTKLPYRGYLQPYGTWFALGFYFVVIFVRGYVVFLPGHWDNSTFFTTYTMVGVAPIFFIGWKVVRKTTWVKPLESDLIWEAPLIDAYEASAAESSKSFWAEMGQMFRWKIPQRFSSIA